MGQTPSTVAWNASPARGRRRVIRGAPREPAVPIALALGTGILLDESWPSRFGVWSCVQLLSLGVSAGLLRSRRRRVATLALLSVWLCVGGLRHHLEWSLRRADNVATFLAFEPQPTRLIARVTSAPRFEEADHDGMSPAWMQMDRSLCEVECEQIGNAAAAVTCSGRVRVEATGHLTGLRVGDEVELVGQASIPAPPDSPGAFDYAAWLRRQGIDGVLRVDHPDHVRLSSSSPTAWERLVNLRDLVRAQCEWTLVALLPASQVPVARSLLLGARVQDADLRADFAASGTMHILAISGMNVALLAGFVHLIARMLKLGRRGTAAVLLVSVLGYAAVTDLSPSVLRATILAVLALAGAQTGRGASGYQTLAVCAIVLLLWRPTDLFDAGAQLSFLAVLAILWSGRMLDELARRRAALLEPERPGWLQLLFGAGRGLAAIYAVTGSIWLFTLPLTIHHFHLVAPVGLLVNVLLMPVVAVMLAAGYLMLLLGLGSTLLAAPAAVVFQWLLALMLWLVHESSSWPLGHFSAPGPSTWWLAGFYLLLAVGVGVVRVRAAVRPAWRGLFLWTLGGLTLGLIPHRPAGLTCTFLPVGHGCSVLIEFPNGRRLLYDAGSLGTPRRAERMITACLWDHGARSVDALLISHADIDHFNGAPGLLRTIPVGTLLCAAPFLDFRQGAVAETCESASRLGVPIRLVQAEDQLRVDDDVAVTVLHPAGTFRGRNDNANSVVLRIDYAARSILLTGDLERDGLEELLRRSPQPVDVLMSPHHGSIAANPPALARWASPRLAILSTGERGRTSAVAQAYPGNTILLSTADAGAIACRISADGSLAIGCGADGGRIATMVAGGEGVSRSRSSLAAVDNSRPGFQQP